MRATLRFLLVPLFVLPLLTACGETTIKPQHVRMATEKCASNSGWAQIEEANMQAQFQSCGARCSRRLPESNYRAKFSCNNGAKFDLAWQE
jgi:hypothetical protein